MKTTLNEVLSNNYRHSRDTNIKFFEKGHKYCILTDPDSNYTSVTTWNNDNFPKFDADTVIDNMMKGRNWKEGNKYWGLTSDKIKDMWNSNKDSAAGSGTELHYQIECFHNDTRLQSKYTNKDLYEIYMSDKDKKMDQTSLEWNYFINFVKDHQHLKPYRTEWTVYDEDIKIAGSIDMVYENPDGTLSIYDWKRTKSISRINNYNKFAIPPVICYIPDTNFWHYALQLNAYKYILETKYDKQIKDLFLVRLHPDTQDKTYELIKLPDLSIEMNDLFQERTNHLSV